MTIQRIAAFSDGTIGGNPAGVLIADPLPSTGEMQRLAAEIGFSESAFAAPQDDGWRVRYFAPQVEVPFCGHATIALGAALAMKHGDGVFRLQLNDAAITVEGRREGNLVAAALQSPPTRSAPADPALLAEALDLFGYRTSDLDPALPPGAIHAGADHLVLALASREKLAAMSYDVERGRALMARAGLITIALVQVENPRWFNVRHAFPFAADGVVEDPATGAGAAALGGYLRDLGWPHGGAIDIVQGEDMGMRSRLRAEIPDAAGASVRVSGTARVMD